MRRRGFIILIATIPTWATLFVLAIPFQEAMKLGIDFATPEYLTGISAAGLIGTLTGFFVVLLDLNSWLKNKEVG